MDAIIAPFRKRTEDEWVNAHLTMLVGAIYWFVSESAALAPGEEMGEASQAAYKGVRKSILVALRGARDGVQIPNPTVRGKQAEITEEQEAAFWEGWQNTIKAADFDQAITEISTRDWLKSDWYRSIEVIRNRAEGDEEVEENDEEQAFAAVHVQTVKPDTMLQEKFDYLSERRRADYREWEAGILHRIELLESGQEEDDMEVDE